MFRRLTAVAAVPVSIILFMLFRAYLQPLDAGRLLGENAARTGRFALILTPYGLAALGVLASASAKSFYKAKRGGRKRLCREA